jgi:hypothetical protein
MSLSKACAQVPPLVYVLLCLGSCSGPPTSTRSLTLTEVGLRHTIGLDEQGPANALFQQVLGAALLEDRIVVLDAATPFVRSFTYGGELIGTAGRRGRGPGEFERPLGLARGPNGGLLITERDRVQWLDETGTYLSTDNEDVRYVKGAHEACGGRILRLVTTFAGYQKPGAVTIAANLGAREDTLLVIDSMRANTLRAHPFMLASHSQLVALYGEELGSDRLTIFSCNDPFPRHIPLDSIGRPEHFVPRDDGTFLLYPAEPPHPAGLLILGGDLVWATREVRQHNGGVDSVTHVVAYHEMQRRREITLDGWFTVLGSNGEYVVMANSEPVSHVLILDQATFHAALTEAR